MLCERFYAHAPLLGPNRTNAIPMLCQIEQTLAVLWPAIVRLLHVLQETFLRCEVLVAQPAWKRRQRDRICIELTQLATAVFRQRPVLRLWDRYSRPARSGCRSRAASAVEHRLKLRTLAKLLDAHPRFPHGKPESIDALPGQASVIVLGIPGAEWALLRKPVRAAERDPAGATRLALGENRLVALGTPHACAAPAFDARRAVQEHRW